jgi:hypothetical protein
LRFVRAIWRASSPVNGLDGAFAVESTAFAAPLRDFPLGRIIEALSGHGRPAPHDIAAASARSTDRPICHQHTCQRGFRERFRSIPGFDVRHFGGRGSGIARLRARMTWSFSK